jgi:Tol biopolymer transport system component
MLLRTAAINPPATTFYSVLGATGLGPPSWSADGRTIAVASRGRLELVDARTGRAHRWGPMHAAYPAFSPDGRLLAFATPNTAAGGELIVVVPVHGRGRSWRVHAGVVYDDQDDAYQGGLVRNLTWSPDGRRLAFTRFAVGPYGEFGDSTRILDTDTHRIVATPPSSGDTYHWSPDGRFVVQGGTDTLISRSDGHPLTTLPGLRAVEPSWQPLCSHKARAR